MLSDREVGDAQRIERVAAYRDRRLEAAAVAAGDRADYRKWMRFHLDFCQKYGHLPREMASVDPFLAKLASKGRTEAQPDQALEALRSRYYGNGIIPEPDLAGLLSDGYVPLSPPKQDLVMPFSALDRVPDEVLDALVPEPRAMAALGMAAGIVFWWRRAARARKPAVRAAW